MRLFASWSWNWQTVTENFAQDTDLNLSVSARAVLTRAAFMPRNINVSIQSSWWWLLTAIPWWIRLEHSKKCISFNFELRAFQMPTFFYEPVSNCIVEDPVLRRWTSQHFFTKCNSNIKNNWNYNLRNVKLFEVRFLISTPIVLNSVQVSSLFIAFHFP